MDIFGKKYQKWLTPGDVEIMGILSNFWYNTWDENGAKFGPPWD